MPPSLTDDEFRLFSEWLADTYGLRFGPEKREILRARLDPRRAALNLPTFERLLFHLRFHPDRDQERLLVLSHLTNNESYFFRERKQLDVMREEVLPAIARQARQAGRRSVQILSAGSAGGEEAYTLAIIAREVLRGKGMEAAVTGVDLDTRALERAREGLYRDHAFRGVEPAVRERYFRTDAGAWRLDSSIREAARFQHGNLVDPQWSGSLPPQDVVFCRNVMIYFDKAGVRRAADNLYEVVRPGGFLFLGHAETLSRIPTRFVPVRRPGAVFYQRPKE
ncbi:MAG: protein-glutamate O-methyltransferase CheR [Gemmatimonadetes bacterium]|nr:protein-glutamate O-methyltransferase CheR [Gemmatimonadota bacterium]